MKKHINLAATIFFLSLSYSCSAFDLSIFSPKVGAQLVNLFGKSVDDAFTDTRVADLIKAATQHQVNEVEHQISLGADINALGERGITPLLWVQMRGDTQAVELLLKLGADANKYGPMPNGTVGFAPPVFVAASAGQTDILKLLLQHGGNANAAFNRVSALMKTLEAPHYDCGEILLSYGADINFNDHGEFTAFQYALGFLQYDRVLWVLEHGYTHRMELAQHLILKEHRKTRSGQEAMKEKAIQLIANYLAQHPVDNPPQ